MRVSQEDSVYTIGRDGERLPVSPLELPFLIESTIYEKPGAVGLQEVARTRNILGRTKEL